MWLQTHIVKGQTKRELIASNLEKGGYSVLMKGVVPSTISRFIISGGGFTLLSGYRNALQHSSPYFCNSEDLRSSTPFNSSSFFKSQRHASPLHTTAIAGACTGATLAIIAAPLELIKIQMQNQLLCSHLTYPSSQQSTLVSSATALPNTQNINFRTPRWRNTWHCASDLVKEHGFSILFKGYGTTLLRNPPFWATYYYIYEGYTRHFNGETEVGYNKVVTARGNATIFTAGLLAGGLSWLIVMPFDYIKTQIQSQNFSQPLKYKGILDCASQTYRNHGLRKFYAGVIPTVFRGAFVNAVIFVTFEWLFKIWDKDGILKNYKSITPNPDRK